MQWFSNWSSTRCLRASEDENKRREGQRKKLSSGALTLISTSLGFIYRIYWVPYKISLQQEKWICSLKKKKVWKPVIKLWLPSFICNGNNAVWTCKVGRYSIKVTISIISLSKTMILDPWPFYIILGQVFCTKQFKAFAVASVFHLSLGQLIFRPHPMRLFFSLFPELRYYSTT